MAVANHKTIIDGDGHIFEDGPAISAFMPAPYRERGPLEASRLFPPLDHLHAAHLSEAPPGAFRRVGVEGWIEFLQDVGIETTVLYPTSALSYGKITAIDWAVAVTRAYNDWLYDAYLTKDPCFKGMALIPMQDPQAAVVELRRAVEELGMCGAMLPATGLSAHLGSRQFWPIYEEADRLGCCLAVHGGCHSGLGFDDMNFYPAVHGLGHPFGQMISFAGILGNGIFEKFPNARFAFLEGGVAWLLLCIERLTESYASHIPYDPGTDYLQLEPGEKVSDYIIRHIKEGRIYVGCEGGEPTLGAAVHMVGSEPFLYSSDFPHEVNVETCTEEIQELLESEEITPADKEAILHTNAERFYRLQPSQ